MWLVGPHSSSFNAQAHSPVFPENCFSVKTPTKTGRMETNVFRSSRLHSKVPYKLADTQNQTECSVCIFPLLLLMLTARTFRSNTMTPNTSHRCHTCHKFEQPLEKQKIVHSHVNAIEFEEILVAAVSFECVNGEIISRSKRFFSYFIEVAVCRFELQLHLNYLQVRTNEPTDYKNVLYCRDWISLCTIYAEWMGRFQALKSYIVSTLSDSVILITLIIIEFIAVE